MIQFLLPLDFVAMEVAKEGTHADRLTSTEFESSLIQY
jgi:hypothetical protein